MPLSASLKFTSETLLQKIRTSVLTEEQKKELLALLPDMTESERSEIANLIDESVKAMIAADPELQKKIGALNAEYNQKIQELVHHESRRVREGFERLEKQTEIGAEQVLEAEIAEDQASAAKAQVAPKTKIQGSFLTHKKKVWTFVFILIAVLTATLIYVFA